MLARGFICHGTFICPDFPRSDFGFMRCAVFSTQCIFRRDDVARRVVMFAALP